jgi:DNA-binding NtrC family response regulator
MPLQSSSRRPPVLIGDSRAMREVREEIARAARTQAKVLVLGETGVGKEVVAHLIHQDSARKFRPFVAVNCSGIPETLLASELFGHVRGSFTGAYRDRIGLVRQADAGTLFLDELGEMSLPMQAALLRFTESGEIQPVGADRPVGRTDVRLITATNRDLAAQIRAGAFREDLYYRLNVIQITIPPLRERDEDVLVLLDHYLKQASEDHHVEVPVLSSDARQTLLSYRWPGNVRELKNVAERLLMLRLPRAIEPYDLPAEIRDDRTSTGKERRSVEHAPATARYADTGSTGGVLVDQLWTRMMAGEDFWNTVHRAFKTHAITRRDLAAIVDRGLQKTRGRYRAMLPLFNMQPADYKRFHAFLCQHKCNLPVASYRHGEDAAAVSAPAPSSTTHDGRVDRVRHDDAVDEVA